MSNLTSLFLKQAYHKPEDDIAHSFYLPCLSCSTSYDRAVGFFSSAIYVLAWPSLKSFVTNGGKIRMICSPMLAANDVDAIREGYSARIESEEAELIKAEFRRLLTTPGIVKPAKVLAALVALEIIDFRIAWVGDTAGGQIKRLFHDKLGIFKDDAANIVVFKGSMNETWPGLSLDGNLESIDVFVSWAGERERSRVEDEQQYFDKLWDGTYPGVKTVSLPEIARNDIITAADTEHWQEMIDEICVEIEATSIWSPEKRPGGRVPLPHQVAALEAWRARGRRGILEHATGSGKTFTALCAIKESLECGEIPLVLVPSDLLLKQWTKELKSTFDDLGLRLLICGGGHSNWREDGGVRAWTRPLEAGQAYRAVLSTIQTASTPQFIALCRDGEHIFLIADEVHRLGAFQTRRVLDLKSGPRLGLSATPDRAGDPVGTDIVLTYFQGIVPPPFTIYDAINAGTLTPYVYYVHRINLTIDEQNQWNKLTKEIKQLYAITKSQKNIGSEMDQRIKLLLIRRAHIVKSASSKISSAVSIISTSYKRGQHWIVYCDDQVQLAQVRDAIRTNGCNDVLEYHTAMAGDPSRTLDLFATHGGVMVSIKCLDEGIDIPAVSHALILASSQNPREYIQRRGRVLRKYPGKRMAYIHDVLVTPQFDPDEPPATAILEGELARAIEFGNFAMNPGCITELQRLAIEHNLDWKSLLSIGIEDDDKQDEVKYD